MQTIHWRRRAAAALLCAALALGVSARSLAAPAPGGRRGEEDGSAGVAHGPDPYRWGAVVGLQLGAGGSPTGTYGGSLAVEPLRYVSIQGAIGWSAWDGGPQLAAMLRLRWPLGPVAFGAGVGLADGPWLAVDSTDPYAPRWDHAHRLNREVSVEFRWANGWLGLLLHLGWSRILNTDSVRCERAACWSIGYPTEGPYAGAAFIVRIFGR